MNRLKKFFVLLPLALLTLSNQQLKATMAGSPPADGKEVVLKAGDVNSKIFPEQVFFRGKAAPVQLRNSGGVHFADDLYVLAALVDSSGYASGIKEKYQAYFISEVTLEIGGQTLKPGSYGVGIVGGKFVAMDLGANDVLQGTAQNDAALKHAMPLQVLASATAGSYRLYIGKDYVEFHRAH